MSTLQNLFKNQPQANRGNVQPNQIMSRLNSEQRNNVAQFMGKNEQERAEKIAQILNEKGITKPDLENFIKRFRK